MAEIKDIIFKIQRARKDEVAQLLRDIVNYTFRSKDEILETLRVLISCMKERDEIIRNTAIEVLEHIVVNGILEKFLIEDQVQYLISERKDEVELLKDAKLYQNSGGLILEHPEVHDFAEFIADFHHEHESDKVSPVHKPQVEVDENYLKFMEKREKYIELWDFEIPEE